MNRLIYRSLSGTFGARLELRVLTRRTAEVFGEKAPRVAGRSATERLKNYAVLTASGAERALRSGQDLMLLHRELYQMAERLGSRVRRWTRPRDERDCATILEMLYRHLGITMREETPGRFRVSACFFSATYTPEVCAVISAIDQGVFAGVCGGGTLEFRERITEGKEACRADFIGKGPSTDEETDGCKREKGESNTPIDIVGK